MQLASVTNTALVEEFQTTCLFLSQQSIFRSQHSFKAVYTAELDDFNQYASESVCFLYSILTLFTRVLQLADF